ncbi:MAG: bifunctional diguanylate cyclase/phosphodiesterase [Methylomonas sp.]
MSLSKQLLMLVPRSLSNQLLALILILFCLIFSVNFALSIGNIKAYLEGEAKQHARNTAYSLALSLSPFMKDTKDPVINVMVDAIFDTGFYEEIRLVDANGTKVYAPRYERKAEGVPEMFIDLLPISPAIAEKEINSGWTKSGVVYVTVNTSFAYSKLYSQAKTSFWYSLCAFAISVALLMLILRVTLASLKRIDRLALEIADNHFGTIEKLPCTSEVRNVAVSMNVMSRKIKETIDNLERALADMGARLLRDDQTGLHKKAVFDTDMKRLLMDHGEAYLLLIKVDSLTGLVKDHGREAINQLLLAFAGKLQQLAELDPKTFIKAYRFYGGEFAMLVHSGDLKQIQSIANALRNDFSDLGEQYKKSDLAHIGVVRVNPVGTPESVLESAQEAYEQARLIGANGYYILPRDNFVGDICDWKKLVFDSVDNASYLLSYVGQITSLQSGQTIMEEAFTQVHDKNDQLVAIGPFVSIAEKFDKIVDLDKGVIHMALAHIDGAQIQHAIAVNLSTRTIKNAEFCLWLEKLINTNQIAAKQLVFSFSAYAVAKDVEVHADFIQALHQWGGRVMIKRFEAQSLSPDVIKTLKPDFVRLARELGEGISRSRQKYDFVQAMQHMSRLLEFAVLAENIQTDDDYQALMEIGIEGASR